MLLFRLVSKSCDELPAVLSRGDAAQSRTPKWTARLQPANERRFILYPQGASLSGLLESIANVGYSRVHDSPPSATLPF